MKTSKLPWVSCSCSLLAVAAALGFATPASAQLLAYDDASNYVISANWTNDANQGYGFTPWAILTSGPDHHGTYAANANKPAFVIATVGSLDGTNYTNVWGLYANGTNDVNTTMAFRGFTNSLGTNTFKLQWGSRGAGTTTLSSGAKYQGYCGLALRSGNETNSIADLYSGARLLVYFLDGNSTLLLWDGNGVQNIPGTSFSDLGRADITNAVQVEVTPGADGSSYFLLLKDCVQGRTLFATNSILIGSGTVDSVAMFCQETTGDQVYNRMQIAVPHIPPTIVNVEPANGSLYLDTAGTSLSFEVDSFNSTVASSAVSVYLNGVLQPNVNFNTTSPTPQLLGSCTPALAPNTLYTYTIIAQDAGGNSVTNTSTFNTFLASNLYIDAADYNYGAGQYFGGATPVNAFAGLFGTNGIDYLETDLAGTNNLYRPGDLPQILSLNADATGDPIDHAGERGSGYAVYNLGFTDIGEWQNYTRTLPSATNYSLYARAASGNGAQFEIEQLVNPTASSSNQPLAALGRVKVPNTGGSRTYSGQLAPLTDFYGNTVVVPLSGTRTFRTTALQSRTYNLEYLVVVPVTNATSILRPYIAAGSPAPNATGVAMATPITFTLAHRQTTVLTNTIKLYTNSVQVTAALTLSSNAVGTVVTFTPTANFAANSTNTVMVTFTDSGSANLTNTWSFVTSSSGGTYGNGLWSGAGADQNWSTAANWTGGTPGFGYTATFASAGGTTSLVTNNIVATNTSIQGLLYSTNNNGFHTTYIADGVTLTVTNGATGTAQAFQVGADNVFNKKVTNTIAGANGTLVIAGNPFGSGQANQLNFQIRQCASPAAAEQTTLDLSKLGTLVATVGKLTVGQGGTAVGQSNVSARVSLARTNVITLLRNTSGQFVVGDSSGGAYPILGSTLNLGVTNALYFDSMNVGSKKATGSVLQFNPEFTSDNAHPSVLIRGMSGGSARVAFWNIGDVSTEATVPVNVTGAVDFSGGTVDAMVNTVTVGQGSTSASDTGSALGTLAMTAGTMDVTTLKVGVQRAANTATTAGIVDVLGSATLVCPSVTLAQVVGGTPSLTSGTLNITNGTARVSIAAGGGVSTVNVDGGSLVVTGVAGTGAAPLSALNLKGASLHLSADGNATAAVVNATAVAATSTTLTVDSVANVTGPCTIRLIGYSGASPFAGLSLAPLPAGYTGTLVNNNDSVDLQLNVAVPPAPTLHQPLLSGGQFIFGGTNNNHGVGGGTYRVLTSTNVALPLSSWSVLATGTFDANGSFWFTNSMTNSQRFYLLQVP